MMCPLLSYQFTTPYGPQDCFLTQTIKCDSVYFHVRSGFNTVGKYVSLENAPVEIQAGWNILKIEIINDQYFLIVEHISDP